MATPCFCSACTCWAVWSTSLVYQLDLPVWSTSLIYQFDLPAWSTSLVYQLDLPVWSTSLVYQLDLPVWSTSLVYQLDLPVWSTSLIYQLGLPAWSTSLIIIIIHNFSIALLPGERAQPAWCTSLQSAGSLPQSDMHVPGNLIYQRAHHCVTQHYSWLHMHRTVLYVHSFCLFVCCCFYNMISCLIWQQKMAPFILIQSTENLIASWNRFVCRQAGRNTRYIISITNSNLTFSGHP